MATVAASHNRIVLSAPPEAMRVPSGLKATLNTGPRGLQGCPTGWPVAASHNRMVFSSPADGESRCRRG